MFFGNHPSANAGPFRRRPSAFAGPCIGIRRTFFGCQSPVIRFGMRKIAVGPTAYKAYYKALSV
jgi:hypothetical protein